LSPPGSARALADAISRLALDRAEARRYEAMGAAARNWIAATHGLDAQARRVAELYHDLNPRFGAPPDGRMVGVLRTLNRDTRKTPFHVRSISDLGPAFNTPEKARLLHRLINESEEGIAAAADEAAASAKQPTPAPAPGPPRPANPATRQRATDSGASQRAADLAWSIAQILSALFWRGDVRTIARLLWRAARVRRRTGNLNDAASDLSRIGRAIFSDRESMKFLGQPPPDFDETAYLSEHKDVRAAVEKGTLASGFAHYVKHGFRERRGRPRPRSG
jgi:hypothetical protein